jgi:calcineurin-like phosphoesterase
MGPPAADHASKSILFVGDVVGGLGRRTLLRLLPELREELAPSFVVVNGENAAGGLGITPRIADEMFGADVDVITLGNHTYKHREIYPYLDEHDRILRPANFLRAQPGHGTCVVEKVGMGWHLDGRVTAVVGTHTHVPTADARVLPGGTAYITDVGMTGPRGGVIGVKKEQAVAAMATQMPARFETSEDDPWLMGVLVRCAAEPYRAATIEPVLRPAPDVH